MYNNNNTLVTLLAVIGQRIIIEQLSIKIELCNWFMALHCVTSIHTIHHKNMFNLHACLFITISHVLLSQGRYVYVLQFL